MVLSWFWRSLPLNQLTGSQVFERLFYQAPQPGQPPAIATLLESPFPTPENSPQSSRYSLIFGSPRVIAGKPQIWTPKIGQVFSFLESRVFSSRDSIPTHLPFIGGWVGWLGYDVAWEIEKLPYRKADYLPFPVAFWYEPESFAILDHSEQKLWLASTKIEDLDQLEIRLEKELLCVNPDSPHKYHIKFDTSKQEYEYAVRQALKYIRAGDIFQTNLSLRFETTTQASSWRIYRVLQKLNPSPFASYWQTPWGAVISCSPERLIQLQGQTAQTRPIAGTRARGINPSQEKALEADLITNVKEIAEHIMLVDLERNDLGKVCQWGSVQVNELLTIERYSHVIHLVSNIKGCLAQKYNSIDLIKAMFPGGTITGCPKVRCLEIIEELEPVRRNLFYGSCGYLDQRGHLDLNILIRTLLYTQESSGARVWGQVGAGIVADSIPEQEWAESLKKAEAQLTALKELSEK